MRAIKVYCPPGVEPPLYAFIDALDGKLKAMVLNTIMAGAMQRTTSGRHYPMECPAIRVSDVWKRFDFLAW
jgi:hypothetical protein